MHSSKLGSTAFSVFALPHEIDRIITGKAAAPAIVDELCNQDVVVDLV